MTTTPLSDTEIENAIRCMERIGGGFASALAKAWLRADLPNRHRIEQAFPNLITCYAVHVVLAHGEVK